MCEKLDTDEVPVDKDMQLTAIVAGVCLAAASMIIPVLAFISGYIKIPF